ncbi:D-amino acid dehydrogenase small subunit [mine drainage metagenome]|uniref:D-amino acid dehydrogenase small subunit n=1 Tax=mine drainage metagenome TaxID=410659 RepID=A0A1J5R8J8_9ZZZZ
MRIIVLGAGVVGVASAFFLRERGHDVTVIERQPQVAARTSRANGGQISVSGAEPWANPGVPRQLLAWLGRRDAPLRLRLRADPGQWAWCLRFLLECTAARSERNMREIVHLGLYSREVLRALRERRELHYDAQRRGILHLYGDERALRDAAHCAQRMREFGCERRVVDVDEALRIEPALRAMRASLAGATYTSGDESGDAHAFTHELARHCTHDGVRFAFGHTATALRRRGDAIDHVEATAADGSFERFDADAYVLACGCWSAPLARSAGLALPIHPVKGYSVTLPVADEAAAWQVSLTDERHKLVFSRLGRRLRVAGTAEVGGWSRELDEARGAAIVDRVATLFPGAADTARAVHWSGLRPMTPGNVPLIGRSRLRNLFLNTGHGSLGWTLACGSAAALASLVDGQRPDVRFAFTGI